MRNKNWKIVKHCAGSENQYWALYCEDETGKRSNIHTSKDWNYLRRILERYKASEAAQERTARIVEEYLLERGRNRDRGLT